MAVFDALLLAKTKASVLSICLQPLTDLPFFSSLPYVLKTLFHFNLFPDILPMPTVQRASGVIFLLHLTGITATKQPTEISMGYYILTSINS